MKKLTALILLALALSLASCTVANIEEEKVDDVKEEIVTPSDMELPELPWADGPVETPMIPPEYMDESEVIEEEQPEETVTEPTQPEKTDAPALDDKELPILQIVPEENETPAIPLN